MMKTVAVLAFAILAASQVSAQLTTPKGSKSDATLIKIHKLDLLIKLLPLAMKKEQFSDLLTAIEKAHEQERKILEGEDDVLELLDPEISKALDAGLNQNAYPPPTLQNEIQSKTKSLSLNRIVAMDSVVEGVFVAVTKSFNTGQIKVMAGSFDDRFIDPNAKKGDFKDDTKVRFFIQDIFLDPYCYDMLIQLAKSAASGAPPPKQ